MKKSVLSFFYNKLFEREDQAKVLLVDDNLFFTDTTKVNHAFLSENSLRRLVELRIESICPFNFEDILYGYVWRKKERSLTIFIAYKPRVVEKYGDLTKFQYILPRFFCELLYGSVAHVQSAKFVNKYIIFSPKVRLCTASKEIYRANMVEHREKTKRLYRDISKKYFEYGTYLCAFCLILMIPLCGVVAKKEHQFFQFNKLLNPVAVQEIVSKQLIINKLERFFKSEKFCLYGLDKINVIRPDSVLFSDVHMYSGARTLSIKGHADSIGEVMNYQRMVDELPEVKRAAVSHVYAKDREAFFDMEVQFE